MSKFEDWDSTAVRGSICGMCKHKFEGMKACTAFLEGIPADFLSGKKDHTILTGAEDSDVVFEKGDWVGEMPRKPEK